MQAEINKILKNCSKSSQDSEPKIVTGTVKPSKKQDAPEITGCMSKASIVGNLSGLLKDKNYVYLSSL